MTRSLLTLLVVFHFAAQGQSLAPETGNIPQGNLKLYGIHQSNGILVLHYDLTDRPKKFFVRIYSSQDNFVDPLIHVAGDVGVVVTSGENKSIKIDLKKEFGRSFRGSLKFEVRALPIEYNQPYDPTPYTASEVVNLYKTGRIDVSQVRHLLNFSRVERRGMRMEFFWTRELEKRPIEVELYQIDKERTLSSSFAFGRYSIRVPDVPSGDYRLKIFETGKHDEGVFTPWFRISNPGGLDHQERFRKIAIVASVTGFFILGVVIACQGAIDPPGWPH